MAAVAAAALYGVALLRLNSTRWAVALVAAFCLGSLAWPYSKIGIETTLMSLIALTLALVLLTSRVRRVLVWSLAGFVAGAAAVAKPYALLGVIPLFVPLAWELRRGDNVKRGQLAVAFAVPFLVGSPRKVGTTGIEQEAFSHSGRIKLTFPRSPRPSIS